MSLQQRVRRLEAGANERELWQEVRRLAEKLQLDPAELFREAKRIAGRQDELQAAGLTEEEARRASFEEDGMDPDWAEREFRRLLEEEVGTGAV